MIKSTTTQTHPEAEIQNLRATVSFMDCLAQGALSEIGSIARLALSHLETPDAYQHMEDVANALTAIWGRADTAVDHIHHEACQVGCCHIDEAKHRRLDASRRARDADKGAP